MGVSLEAKAILQRNGFNFWNSSALKCAGQDPWHPYRYGTVEDLEQRPVKFPLSRDFEGLTLAIQASAKQPSAGRPRAMSLLGGRGQLIRSARATMIPSGPRT